MTNSYTKYFYAFPKLASALSRSDADETNNNFNYENPLKRQRDTDLQTNSSSSSTKKFTFLYPSSYFPDILFKNTVPHPYLIFYNLHLKDLEMRKGSKNIASDEPIVAQLNRYFNVKDILSFTSSKNDFHEISETWNNRFPDAKSSSFSLISEDFRIEDLQDLQSLHFFAFQLNATFYLLFKIDKGEDSQYYNMKLGPDSSDFDIHFLVHENINKIGIEYPMRDGTKSIVYKHDLWLSLQLVEMAYFTDKRFQPSTPKINSEKGSFMFLELEKRDPIPFIQIPTIASKFKNITYCFQKVTDNSCKCNISIKYVQKKGLRIYLKATTKYNSKINKIKSIANILDDSLNPKFDDLKKHEFNDFLLAQTNRSAFLVDETSQNVADKNFALEMFKNIRDEDKMSFPPIENTYIYDEIKQNIISYRERLKFPITYSQIVSTKHPLIYALCTYNIVNIMLKGADYLFEALKIDHRDANNVLKVIPIENDDIFLSYQDYMNCKPNGEEENINEWKELTETYPQLLTPGALYKEYGDSVQPYVQKDSPLFAYFYYNVDLERVNNYFYEYSQSLLPIAQTTIRHYKDNKIGLNPIVAPIIYREYFQLSKTCCIHFFSNKIYDRPVNDLLMRDIQTIKEFKSRTTIHILKDEVAVEENAKKGAFPIKKQTFIDMLQKKGNKQIPDPSFDFKITEDNQLLNTIINCNGSELNSFEPMFLYQFYPIINDDIIYMPQFSVSSHYQLKYIYVSRGNVYSVGITSEKDMFAYGKCETLDTEVFFQAPILGEFIDAVFLEENSCLIICYKFDNKIYFTGYDKIGQINQSNIDFQDDVKSMVVVSRTFFASYNGTDENNGYSVFKYNPKERRVEYNKYTEKWRILKDSFGKADLYKSYLKNESDRGKLDYQPCFIGSQFSFGSNMSTYSIYKYDKFDNSLVNDTQKKDPLQPEINFSLENKDQNTNNNDQSEEDVLIEKRIESKDKVIIPTMINVLQLKKKGDDYNTPLELYSVLCELFPFPIVINNRLIMCSDQMLSFYHCDHKIYRSLSNQIYGFYINTLARVNFFSIESLLNLYNFKNVQIALIVDTCGIGEKFANIFFGTRFDEKVVLTDEIWTGFSYSQDKATIVFISKVNDTESIFNAVNNNGISPFIFYCKKDGVKNSIKLGSPSSENNRYKELIKIGNNNMGGSRFTEITFVSNTEFKNNVLSLRQQYDDKLESKGNLSYDSSQALNTSKMIIARYLTFAALKCYPIETIEKYATEEAPSLYSIKDYIEKTFQ